ncbi:MAG: FtsW/RodA/SpoVE family cell cycle protein, partial [Gammaproteobacteria bacterium]|nr:FtsW/RodA/SpoVE family cell cycle protein [Gammaproteobacteria bacterium]
VVLLLAQPDFGSAVVIMAAIMGMIYLADVPVKSFFPVIVLGLAAALAIALLQPYRLERFATFINPWKYQYDAGYQLTQALIAFGRGELFGVGLGNSIQKLFYLPEAHTDFLFSIVAEELGVPGAILLVFLVSCLIVRGIFIGLSAYRQQQVFGAYLAYGVSLLIAIQALINFGVNLGLLPTKGLTLPLVSFGGNSLIVSCVLVALLLRIDYETKYFPVGRNRRA